MDVNILIWWLADSLFESHTNCQTISKTKALVWQNLMIDERIKALTAELFDRIVRLLPCCNLLEKTNLRTQWQPMPYHDGMHSILKAVNALAWHQGPRSFHRHWGSCSSWLLVMHGKRISLKTPKIEKNAYLKPFGSSVLAVIWSPLPNTIACSFFPFLPPIIPEPSLTYANPLNAGSICMEKSLKELLKEMN